MPQLRRNTIYTDPSTGARSVLKAGTEVDETVAATLNPKAFDEDLRAAAPAQTSREPVVRIVDETPLRDALIAYGRSRGLDISDGIDGLAVLDALTDLDTDAPAPDNGGTADGTDPRIAEVLERKVDDVNAYLDAHPEDVQAVLAAEGTAKSPRKGITEGPHAAAPPAQQE